MTLNKITIAEAKKSHPLAAAVLRQLGGGQDAIQSAVDAAGHGADAGFSGFTYYADTCSFTSRHRTAIAEAVKQMADDLGEQPFAMVKGFGCFKNDAPSDEEIARALFDRNGRLPDNIKHGVELVENALAWFALEEVGRAITDLQER